MLSHLTIRDFAVVSAAELSFNQGLTVVSGETGAGKSLLVDALLTLTGARADAGMVRHGAERAELHAEFDPADCPPARAWLAANELDEGESCQLRRVIRADGGSRSWINGRPATLAQLAELGAMLVEIHGQHEHQALLDRAHQLALVDAFAGNAAVLESVRAGATRWQEISRELEQLQRAGDVGERIDYLQHQHDELLREKVEPDEVEKMLSAHRRHANASALLASYDQALAALSTDGGGVARALRQARGELVRHVENEPQLAEAVALVESAGINLEEAARLVERLRDDLDLDPGHLAELESRMARWHDLARKHRVSMHDLGEKARALADELDALLSIGERSARLAEAREAAAGEWLVHATQLSHARQQAAAGLARAVASLMAELGMPGAEFAVHWQPLSQDKPGAAGIERCEFMVSANPGQPARALRKVASGGELARISLAIEVAALGLDAVPTMVFDEVDSGIGGAVAEVVGQKLRALGGERQVLCVTHLPQVAAQGHHHFQVSKAVNGGGTQSAVAALSGPARVEELARMLGGVEITRETRANARQMLNRAQA